MKKSIVKKGFLAIAFITLGTLQANAQQGNREGRKSRPSFEQLLEEMDANKDGKLSKEETKGPIEKHFDKIDANQDGFITKEELENTPKKKGKKKGNSKKKGKKSRLTFEQLLAKKDTNKDGLISKEEANGPLEKHFEEIDTDNDGVINKDEFENAPKPERKKGGREA